MSDRTPTTPPATVPRNGLGLAAIILGLIGILFGLVPFTGFIAIALGITGLALALAGLGRVRRGQATNRWTTRIAALLSASALALGIYGMTVVFGAVDQLDEDLEEIDQQFEDDMAELDEEINGMAVTLR